MRLAVVILATLISACLAKSSLLRVKPVCRGMTMGGVKCVTSNQFVMSFQDPMKDQPTECPRGMVCANVEEICSKSEPAVCEKKSVKGVCNKCPSDIEYNPVCVNDSEYAFCADEKIQFGMRYKCPNAAPYCRADFNPDFTLKSICSAEPGTDCPRKQSSSGSGGGSNTGGGSVSSTSGGSSSSSKPSSSSSSSSSSVSNPTCTSDGWFPDPNDLTCRGYHRCLPAAGGKFIKIGFKCVIMNSIFDPISSVCVSDGSYSCPT